MNDCIVDAVESEPAKLCVGFTLAERRHTAHPYALSPTSSLHCSMRNRKDIAVAKLVRLGLARRQKLAKQILPVYRVLAGLLPAVHFRDCDSRDERVLGRKERHVLPQRVPAEKIVEERDLAHDAVVPLRVVDRFDGAVDVNTGVEEAEFPRESHLAKNLEEGMSVIRDLHSRGG